MLDQCLARLRRLKKMEKCFLQETMTIRNLVVRFQLTSRVFLNRVQNSNSDHSYEVEIFPALLTTKWHPIHFTIFHNGHVVMTGAKSLCQVESVIKEMLDYLKQNNFIEDTSSSCT